MADNTKQFAAEPKLIKTVAVDHQLGCAQFSADGKLLAAGAYDATVRLWQTGGDDLKPLPPLKGHNGWVDALVFHPTKPLLFSADTWGRLVCWNCEGEAPAQPRVLWSHDAAHDGWIRSVAISANGHTLATCGRDRIVRIWSVADGKLQHELKDHNEDVYSVAFHPTDHTLVSGDLKGTIRVWDLNAGKTARTIDASSLYKYDRIQDVGGARYLNFSRDGSTLLCGGAVPKGGGFVEASPRILGFDFKSGEKKIDLALGEPKDGFVYEVHEHADGYLMAVTSGQPGNGRMHFVRPNETAPFFTGLKMANCHALALHPNGKLLAVLATNANSAGNGRRVDKDGEYVGNTSPIHLWKFEG